MPTTLKDIIAVQRFNQKYRSGKTTSHERSVTMLRVREMSTKDLHAEYHDLVKYSTYRAKADRTLILKELERRESNNREPLSGAGTGGVVTGKKGKL